MVVLRVTLPAPRDRVLAWLAEYIHAIQPYELADDGRSRLLLVPSPAAPSGSRLVLTALREQRDGATEPYLPMPAVDFLVLARGPFESSVEAHCGNMPIIDISSDPAHPSPRWNGRAVDRAIVAYAKRALQILVAEFHPTIPADESREHVRGFPNRHTGDVDAEDAIHEADSPIHPAVRDGAETTLRPPEAREMLSDDELHRALASIDMDTPRRFATLKAYWESEAVKDAMKIVSLSRRTIDNRVSEIRSALRERHGDAFAERIAPYKRPRPKAGDPGEIRGDRVI